MLNNISESDLEELRSLFISRGPSGSDTLKKILKENLEELNNSALSGQISGHDLSYNLGKSFVLKEFVGLIDKLRSHKTGGTNNGSTKGRPRVFGQ